MIPFEKSSYQTQVLRLRAFAINALKEYPLKVDEIDFINHGENATFKITARRERRIGRSQSETFLFRIHGRGYHTVPAIREELDWLHDLSGTRILAPRPVAARDGSLIKTLAPAAVGERHFDVFEWVPGRFVYKNMRPVHLEKFGSMIAELQLSARKRKSKHRRYWTAQGLLGPDAKFGSVDHLRDVSRKDQSMITGAARELLKTFEKFALNFPDRMGFMHADLHFGNAVFQQDGNLCPIDFDDCGFGFYGYDLCVPLASVYHMKTLKTDMNVKDYRTALIKGYTSKKSWTETDDEMLDLFSIARRILMVGWLNSRSSNPRLKSRFAGAVERAVAEIKKHKI